MLTAMRLRNESSLRSPHFLFTNPHPILYMSVNTPSSALPEIDHVSIAIAVAEWNGAITSRLLEGALTSLASSGVEADEVDVFHVPGAVELTYAASRLVDKGIYDAVIVFGCVVRGDTPHFDYVCESVTQGVTAINSRGLAPVIFGVLTVNNEQQAFDRLGGPAGHKGVEAAETAIRMIAFSRSVGK